MTAMLRREEERAVRRRRALELKFETERNTNANAASKLQFLDAPPTPGSVPSPWADRARTIVWASDLEDSLDYGWSPHHRERFPETPRIRTRSLSEPFPYHERATPSPVFVRALADYDEAYDMVVYEDGE